MECAEGTILEGTNTIATSGHDEGGGVHGKAGGDLLLN